MPIIEPVWLNGIRKNKRTVKKDVKRYLTPNQIFDMITQGPDWEYKRDRQYYITRDNALISMLYLTGARINELLKLRKMQLELLDPEFVLIKDFEISKRKEVTLKREGRPKIDIALPKVGSMGPFTDLAMKHILEVDRERIFTIGRCRAWQIVVNKTGKWCHYFRSQRISQLINLIRSSDATANIMGIKDPGTIKHYYKGTWREFKDELKQ